MKIEILKRPKPNDQTPPTAQPTPRVATKVPLELRSRKKRISLQPNATWEIEQRDNTRKMNEQLCPKEETKPESGKAAKSRLVRPDIKMDICLLEASNFMRNAKRKDVIIGHTSIHEINRLIEDTETKEDPLYWDEEQLRQLIQQKLPEVYQEHADVFSKAASDELPPHRKGVDHDIVLEGENTLATSPLYSMSLEQLQLVKAYLEDHLRKGFIVQSDAPYASPVLFAKKPEGGGVALLCGLPQTECHHQKRQIPSTVDRRNTGPAIVSQNLY